jgi:hypothetical protein
MLNGYLPNSPRSRSRSAMCNFCSSSNRTRNASAFLAHWSEAMSEEDHDRDFISTTAFLESLAEGVKAIG